MYKLTHILLLSLLTIGCSPSPDAVQGDSATDSDYQLESSGQLAPANEDALVPQPQASERVVPPPPKKPLDLSLPPLSLDENVEYPPVESRNSDLDLGPLYKEKQRNFSITVKPGFKFGEERYDLPELEGGSVEMEVKQK